MNCAAYFAATRRRVSFEWAMIDGVNDRLSDAQGLARLAQPLRAHVNLIPLNPRVVAPLAVGRPDFDIIESGGRPAWVKSMNVIENHFWSSAVAAGFAAFGVLYALVKILFAVT